MDILHTMIRTGNLERSIEFYTSALGMTLRRQKDYPGGRFTLAFLGCGEEGGHEIELTYNWDSDSYDLGNGFGHIAIGVEDIYATVEKIRQKGGEGDPRAGADEARHHGDRLRGRPRRLQDRVDRAGRRLIPFSIVIPPFPDL